MKGSMTGTGIRIARKPACCAAFVELTRKLLYITGCHSSSDSISPANRFGG